MKLKLLVIFVLSLFLLSSAYSSVQADYYKDLNSPRNLKTQLFKIIAKGHHSLGYSEARKWMFGELYLKKDQQGHFVVRDVYCHKEITDGVGPRLIPNARKLNCEHTWPQSKFSTSFPKELQKSDLHHLFPTDNRANSTRGNHPFGEVNGAPLGNHCEVSKIGSPQEVNKSSSLYFEPPKEHRGNVARAVFYFSIRYKMPIAPKQEAFLKKWHNDDPVDEDERQMNSRIEELQGNRNPFIDRPKLVSQIQDF